MRVIQPEAADPHNSAYFTDSTFNFNPRDTEKEQEKESKTEKERRIKNKGGRKKNARKKRGVTEGNDFSSPICLQ